MEADKDWTPMDADKDWTPMDADRRQIKDADKELSAEGLSGFCVWARTAASTRKLPHSLVSRSRRRVPTWQRQPHQLDRRIVVGKMPAGLDDLAQLHVDTLERVGRVDHPPDVGRSPNSQIEAVENQMDDAGLERGRGKTAVSASLMPLRPSVTAIGCPGSRASSGGTSASGALDFGVLALRGMNTPHVMPPHKIPDRLCKMAARSALHPRLATIKRAAPFNLRLICVLSALYLRPVFICVPSAFYLRYLRLIFGCLYLRSPPRRLGAWRARHRARRD
jgi:hypothetical protein